MKVFQEVYLYKTVGIVAQVLLNAPSIVYI